MATHLRRGRELVGLVAEKACYWMAAGLLSPILIPYLMANSEQLRFRPGVWSFRRFYDAWNARGGQPHAPEAQFRPPPTERSGRTRALTLPLPEEAVAAGRRTDANEGCLLKKFPLELRTEIYQSVFAGAKAEYQVGHAQSGSSAERAMALPEDHGAC